MAKSPNSEKARILKNNLNKLQKANKAFSLRGLAQKVGVSHVFMSKVLNGKSNPSIELVEKLIVHLKIDSIEAASLRNQEITIKPTKADTADYEAFPENHLVVMSKWWNFAILDLLTCDLSVQFNLETLSAFLPVEKSELATSLKQLTELGFIENTKQGYRKVNRKIRIPARKPSESTRSFYRQTLRLGIDQLNKTKQEDYDKRLILGFTCAVNSKNIPTAKQKLAASLRECAELLSEGPCDDVFIVQGQMFSVLK